MKSILAILIYVTFKDLPLDAILGIVAGLSFGMLCVFVFVGPTPAPRHDTVKATVRKQTQRRIINSTAKQPAYVFVPTNYEWSAA